jgi:hypothetical protein
MYVIKNKINGLFASGDWFPGAKTWAWCELDTAKEFKTSEAAHLVMAAHAWSNVCDVVDTGRGPSRYSREQHNSTPLRPVQSMGKQRI